MEIDMKKAFEIINLDDLDAGDCIGLDDIRDYFMERLGERDAERILDWAESCGRGESLDLVPFSPYMITCL